VKPRLKPLGTERLKLNCGILLSTSAFNCNLRQHTVAVTAAGGLMSWGAAEFGQLGHGQVLTLVHCSAQLEPCLSHTKTLYTLNTPNTPLTRATPPLRAPPIPELALKLS